MDDEIVPLSISEIKTEPEDFIKEEADETYLEQAELLNASELLELQFKSEPPTQDGSSLNEYTNGVHDTVPGVVAKDSVNGDVARRMRSRFLKIFARRQPPCAVEVVQRPRVRVHIPRPRDASGEDERKKRGGQRGASSAGGGGGLRCGACSMAFKNEQYLRQHERACAKTFHGVKEDFRECPECPAVLSDSAALQEHLRLHKDDLFRCDVCGQAFEKLCKLTHHKVRHDKNLLRFQCNDCGRAFPLLTSLRLHQRRHPRQPRQLAHCPHCPKEFRFECMLRRHLKTHIFGRLPPAGGECLLCGEVVVSLSLHSRTHAWRSPYKCLPCGAYFSEDAALQKHKNDSRCKGKVETKEDNAVGYTQVEDEATTRKEYNDGRRRSTRNRKKK